MARSSPTGVKTDRPGPAPPLGVSSEINNQENTDSDLTAPQVNRLTILQDRQIVVRETDPSMRESDLSRKPVSVLREWEGHHSRKWEQALQSPEQGRQVQGDLRYSGPRVDRVKENTVSDEVNCVPGQ